MNFDKIFDLTAGVYFYFYSIPGMYNDRKWQGFSHDDITQISKSCTTAGLRTLYEHAIRLACNVHVPHGLNVIAMGARGVL